MSPEHFSQALKHAHVAKADKEGWESLPASSTLTLYVAHAGTPLTIARVEAVRGEGDLVFARTQKRDVFAVAKGDIVAVAVEGGSKEEVRRAGFG